MCSQRLRLFPCEKNSYAIVIPLLAPPSNSFETTSPQKKELDYPRRILSLTCRRALPHLAPNNLCPVRAHRDIVGASSPPPSTFVSAGDGARARDFLCSAALRVSQRRHRAFPRRTTGRVFARPVNFPRTSIVVVVLTSEKERENEHARSGARKTTPAPPPPRRRA